MSLSFTITHRAAWSAARVGRVTTLHGTFDTPAFMPVGTYGSVKGLLPELVAQTGAQIVLGNTYHLMLRPGSPLIAGQGGLQKWTGWRRPMLTDSGGFQVFSLADINRIHDDGVTFKSHLDGAMIELSPERSMAVQNQLGADIIMAFDDCPPTTKAQESGPEGLGVNSCVMPHSSMTPCPLARATSRALGPDSSVKEQAVTPRRVEQAVERTLRWLDRCVTAHQRPAEQALFGIVQGGTNLDLRTYCAAQVTQRPLPGYAIGGVAVGETFAAMKKVVEHTAPLLPVDRPRYLMGVGYERDLWMAVQAGVDMFDCVLPTRNGRNANAFTRTGPLRLRNARFADDPRPLEEGCDCPACAGEIPGPKRPGVTAGGFSRSYLRHLFQAGEMLGPILVSLHNLRHFQRLMLDIRRAIVDNDPSLVTRNWPVINAPVGD